MARGGFPGGNMNNMMRQVQKMQKDMQKAQERIEEMEFTSTAGGGVVEAVVNGKREVLSVKIDEDVIDPEEKDMLEDMVVAAINDALKKAEKTTQDEMGKLTGGLNIPGLF